MSGLHNLILPGTGRGTIRRMVEGHPRNIVTPAGLELGHVPLHQLRWSPSPKGEDS